MIRDDIIIENDNHDQDHDDHFHFLHTLNPFYYLHHYQLL